MAEKAEFLLLGPSKAVIVDGLSAAFTVHQARTAAEAEPMLARAAPKVRGIAVAGPPGRVERA